MKARTFIILGILLTFKVSAGGPVIPGEWRMPSENELSDEWRNGKYKNAQVIGDFNGDKLIEGAFLAVSKDGKLEGLIAFIYLNNKENWFVLDKHEFHKTVSMGLDICKPGKYKTLCAADEECKKGSKKEITIKHDAFTYYNPEGARSIFMWDSKNNLFEQKWGSD